MKFSPDTLQVLKNFSSINTSIHIKPGNLISTKNADASVVAVAEVNETFEDAIAIFDLPQFLNVWDMFKDPSLEIVGGKQARIVEDKTVARYTFAEPSLIPTAPNGIKETETVASFILSADQFQRLKKAGAAMGLEDITIKGNGEKLIISTVTTKSVSSNSLDIVIGETDREFYAHMKLALWHHPAYDYKVTVTPRNVRFEADISNISLKKLTYWVGVEHDSRF